MSATDAPGMDLPEKVIDTIGFADAAITKAASELAAHEQQAKEAAALIPEAVAAMVSGERIEDTEVQRTKIAEIFKDPVQTLRLLIKVAVHRNAAENSLGAPVDGTGTEKTADNNGQRPYDSLSDPRPGLRTTMVKQSDQKLFSRLGLHPPSG